MPKRINLVQCDCGDRYEIKADGSVDGSKVSEWEISRMIRRSNTDIEVQFVRYSSCRVCMTLLKKQKATRYITVSVDEDTIEEATIEEATEE